MKRFSISFLLIFLVLGCDEQKSFQEEEPLSTVPTKDGIDLDEHNRIVEAEKLRVTDLQIKLNRLIEESSNRSMRDEETIKELEAKVVALNNALSESRTQISQSKSTLKEIKKIGSREYKDIFERTKNLGHQQAILLYEDFLDQFPESPISSKARSRIKYHSAEIMVLENREGARTLRVWDTKLKGEGLFARKVSDDVLFNLIGRKPDSSKRGSSSEYRERTHLWRDYVLDGGYHDLIIETTDGKVDRVYRAE
ncbi:MAG: hypothetical protein HN553_01585 [Opitutae bacterium]|nr:hypothetical protein [Opitutae bacterium]